MAATAAATTTKPHLDALQTPVSATYPSELRSPMVGTPTFIKKEEGMKTPITPPAAYLDFLRTLSPAVLSPMTSGSRTSFSETFGPLSASVPLGQRPHSIDFLPPRPTLGRVSTESSDTTTGTNDTAADDAAAKSTTQSATEQWPARSATRSDSTASIATLSSTTSEDSTKPAMKIIIPPPQPSPFTRPHSARTPRSRLQNPISPFSPSAAPARTPLSASTTARSPLTACSAIYSPYSATSTTSPREWDFDPKRDGQGGKGMRQVSVRQVVTRTVMYTRAPVVDPVPASKRRKMEHVNEQGPSAQKEEPEATTPPNAPSSAATTPRADASAAPSSTEQSSAAGSPSES